MKRKLVRAGIVVGWFLLGTILFITSRGHGLLVDNRNVEALQIEAPKEINVSVDGGAGLAFFRNDRDRFTVTGSRHRIRVEFSDGQSPVEQEFVLPIKYDMYILSVPKMLNGIEPFVEVFHTIPEPREALEEEVPAPDEIIELIPEV
jgi:hypothetical protein